ncbi:uncharacterized protein LOC115631384 [Scaptodrosophila lebanonensis]|uniref:Uncharacterized protein LOC115631384 n=1 Tax=Drosophila lebanonensis TaxID=7225 RepID=A0A6J2U5X6_DROLE|nr:uncharacterized protein LOC115631384 [Scaptodrosophila lebanonensis]
MSLPHYEDMSTNRKQLTSVFLLVLATSLFIFALTTVAVFEAKSQRTNSSESFIISRLWHPFIPGNKTSDEIVATVERIAREAKNESVSNNYYEEQRAVVVHAESAPPVMAERQDPIGPPRGRADSYEQSPYYDVVDDYFNSRSDSDSAAELDDSRESFSSEEGPDGVGEGRAAQNRPYDSYYSGQWKYATKLPIHPSADENNNRKLSPLPSNQNRVPAAYDDLYDWGYRPQAPQTLTKQAAPAAAANPNAHAVAPVQEESTLVTLLKSLKQIWEIYQALAGAWRAIHEHHQKSVEQFKKEQTEKQRLRQQQQQQQKKPRINSKKPPRIESQNAAQRNQTKKAKIPKTTTAEPTTTTTKKTMTTTTEKPSEEPNTEATESVESRKGAKGDAAQKDGVVGSREKRATDTSSSTSNDVGEGRYIKGDPLTGYYDFVITEGSYKFWAFFQVGTACLIIYSTFAAIYYSKVNPLTADYDYQDYLGAGRSLSEDFADDGDDADPAPKSPASDWIPRTVHSLKFILDAIDKLPLDHQSESAKEAGWTDSTKLDRTK